MDSIFSEMNAIFQRTKNALSEFSGLITPIIENATDEHERLYWHHIYEEEDHRSACLDLLGAALDYKCQKGTCGKCKVKIENGHSILAPANELEEKKLHYLVNNGYRLACQARAK